jgi:hypothetical protein
MKPLLTPQQLTRVIHVHVFASNVKNNLNILRLFSEAAPWAHYIASNDSMISK